MIRISNPPNFSSPKTNPRGLFISSFLPKEFLEKGGFKIATAYAILLSSLPDTFKKDLNPKDSNNQPQVLNTM